MSLKTIRLYGQFGAKFGRVHRLDVKSPAEAVQALCAQIPGFERYLVESKDNGFNFAVFIGNKNIGANNLKDPVGKFDIRIAPILAGSKKNGIFQTIVGVVLVVVGVVLSYFGGAGIPLIKLGVGMIIGGVVQLLMPTPKSPSNRDGPESNSSYVFNGPVNTQAQGNPVPLLYGRAKVGSAVISAGITANQEQLAGTTLPSGPVTGGGRWSDRIRYIMDNKDGDQEDLT